MVVESSIAFYLIFLFSHFAHLFPPNLHVSILLICRTHISFPILLLSLFLLAALSFSNSPLSLLTLILPSLLLPLPLPSSLIFQFFFLLGETLKVYFFYIFFYFLVYLLLFVEIVYLI